MGILPNELSVDAHDFYRNATVIDGLDTSRWGDEDVYKDLQVGGVTAINATIAIWDDFESTLNRISDWLGWFEQYSYYIRPVHSIDDIARAKEEGRTGVIFGWQNASPIENDLARLRLFHQLGVRVIQLTYNERNLLGNGCYERVDDGLSRFGQAAVREMNRLGILIDLSHVGDQTTLDAIEHSETPVAITHANARSHIEHPRNKTDEAIRNLVERGGVIGANAFPGFFPAGFEATLENYVDTIDHLVEMAGIDHVAIGTDFCMHQTREFFDWIFSSQGTIPAEEGTPAADRRAEVPFPYHHLLGFDGPLAFVNLASRLLSRGYGHDDTRKVLGGNWLRLFRTVWKD